MNHEEMLELMQSISRIEDMVKDIVQEMKITYYECPICNKRTKEFKPFGYIPRPNAMCPNCHSLERHRALWLHLKKENILNKMGGLKVLHFAPEEAFLDKFNEMWGDFYYPVDLNPNVRGIKKVVDITDISFEENTFDIIICIHVLEHIPDEKKALKELGRVLKPGGVAIIGVPIRNGMIKTLEKEEYNTPELRAKYYGQPSHVRQYGSDFPERLKGIFKVKETILCNDLSETEIKKYGIKKGERMFFCSKIQ